MSFIQNDFQKKYGWIIFSGCSVTWLVRYIRVDQNLWQLGGVFIFAILSIMLFQQKGK